MKKIKTLLFLITVFTLAACGNTATEETDTENAESGTEATDQSATPSSLSEEDAQTVAQMQEDLEFINEEEAVCLLPVAGLDKKERAGETVTPGEFLAVYGKCGVFGKAIDFFIEDGQELSAEAVECLDQEAVDLPPLTYEKLQTVIESCETNNKLTERETEVVLNVASGGQTDW